jgi:hypothetical protein
LSFIESEVNWKRDAIVAATTFETQTDYPDCDVSEFKEFFPSWPAHQILDPPAQQMSTQQTTETQLFVQQSTSQQSIVSSLQLNHGKPGSGQASNTQAKNGRPRCGGQASSQQPAAEMYVALSL